MTLIHLVYVSSALKELEAEELTRLLDSSFRHNAQNNVTGMLLYLNGSFMQVLEGNETEVDETYSRIRQDPRHSRLILIDRAPIQARSFADWSMGFKHMDATDIAAHPAYNPILRSGFDSAVGAREGLALELLKVFAASQGR